MYFYGFRYAQFQADVKHTEYVFTQNHYLAGVISVMLFFSLLNAECRTAAKWVYVEREGYQIRVRVADQTPFLPDLDPGLV